MARGYIIIEKLTARKPEILQIAGELSIHPDHALGLCVRFWIWIDDNCRDGTVKLARPLVDHVSGTPGFADALVSAGWLRDRENALELPNFDRHLSQAAKSRAHATERKRKSRASQNSVTMSQVVTDDELRGRLPRGVRRHVHDRDDHQCVYCGWAKGDEAEFGAYIGAKLSIDHVIPVTRGGNDDVDNLVTACSVCNMRKTNRTPEEAGMVAKYVTEKCDKEVTLSLPRYPAAQSTHTLKRRDKNDSLSKKETKKVFKPPSVEEVRAYCLERKNSVDAQKFVDFYQSKGWMVGKNKMTDWQSAIRSTWEKDDGKHRNGTGNGRKPPTERQGESVDIDSLFDNLPPKRSATEPTGEL